MMISFGFSFRSAAVAARRLQGRHRRRLYLVARIASVRFCDLNWMQLEEYLGGDDRVVLPVGSTDHHADLSLETDIIIAERLAVEAAEPLGVPVLPVLAYGVTDFDDFPGSPTLSPETFGAVVRDILDSLQWQGFRRFVIANSHGGNLPEHVLLDDWTAEYNNVQALWHDGGEG